ncbi:MAG: FAD-dependent oxidoreductase [Sphingobacteriales bacterium]|nr:FAD-dependent oxidoreductase [Sphingobacteriales bacterium]OJY80873.1 MAG: FAD-binding dehydrogenase [Sphingobacteriales bacterium 44-15]
MIKSESLEGRSFPLVEIQADLVIAGGGLSGICAAITAARQGLKVALAHDRSVLGGNASSEIRLWILGATSHMGNNNRWAREGGVVDEILVENMYRNPEGNPLILDTILLDKVVSEPNITLLLNTTVYSLEKEQPDLIKSLSAYCSQNQTAYILKAPLFCDASGDGVVGFLSGAAFRMGAESREEFGERFAPSSTYGELLGHSLYFYSKDTGKPVQFIAPSFALDDITKIPKFRSFNSNEHGCKLWWIEYGGRMDTVHDTEKIKWELWKIVYGVWNYIKNSGNFPEAATLTLEWVGMIPGKRESRRFEGDYILKQQDIVEQRTHDDAIAFGGWSIDLHPSDGIYSDQPGCNQWHSKGVYQIPYRCLYSKNISNLFLAGRIISASHVAFGSSRVMATSAYISQAVAMAAVLCKKYNCMPPGIYNDNHIEELQQSLLKTGQHIPGICLKDDEDITQQAEITASSALQLNGLEETDLLQSLDLSMAQMLPVEKGALPSISLHAYADQATTLKAEFRLCSRTGSFTPDITIASFEIPLIAGKHCVQLQSDHQIKDAQYLFVILHKNPVIKVPRSHKRITGIVTVYNTTNPEVSNYGKQEPPDFIGMDSFEFWCPQRRPSGHNLSFTLNTPISAFSAGNTRNGINRPVCSPNAWVADFNDPQPTLVLQWPSPRGIKKIMLAFDTDFDHPMESVLMSHPENVMPFCIRNYRLYDDKKHLIFSKEGNYQSRNEIIFDKTISTSKLILECDHPSVNSPAAVFEVRCYE